MYQIDNRKDLEFNIQIHAMRIKYKKSASTSNLNNKT